MGFGTSPLLLQFRKRVSQLRDHRLGLGLDLLQIAHVGPPSDLVQVVANPSKLDPRLLIALWLNRAAEGSPAHVLTLAEAVRLSPFLQLLFFLGRKGHTEAFRPPLFWRLLRPTGTAIALLFCHLTAPIDQEKAALKPPPSWRRFPAPAHR